VLFFGVAFFVTAFLESFGSTMVETISFNTFTAFSSREDFFSSFFFSSSDFLASACTPWRW